MKRILLLLCLMLGVAAFAADSPTVPNSIQFADLSLKLSDKARKKIQIEVDALTRSPKYFQIKVDRLQIYFPIIEEIFREEGLPEDFKYLVLQESALISDAVSSSNAVGFWQFKKAAATEVGLRVDRQVDERLNIVASTRGAAKYIKKNNRLYFDNWVHALLAYQQGPGGAQRLVNNKFKGTRSMPIDGRTHWYVIKFLAHKIAFEQVKSAKPNLFLVPYYEGQGKSLKEIARHHQLDPDLVLQYNKWLKQGKVPTNRKYAVILPYAQPPQMLASSTSRSQKKIVVTSDKQVVTASSEYQTHPSKYPVITSYGLFRNRGIKINGIKGVRLTRDMDLKSLASETGIPVKRLLYYNDVVSNKKPKEGELWYVKRKKAKAAETYHIAEMGENLWTISQKYGVRLTQLRKKNRISKKQLTVKPGRVLWLRETRPTNVPIAYVHPTASTEPKGIKVLDEGDDNSPVLSDVPSNVKIPVSAEEVVIENGGTQTDSPKETLNTPTGENVRNSLIDDEKVHVVKQGETLYGIARKYQVAMEKLTQRNRLDQNAAISIGQRLIIPTKNDQMSSSDAAHDVSKQEFDWYQVKQGDTLYMIAREHGTTINELMKFNQKSDFSLSIGEQLKVPRRP